MISSLQNQQIKELVQLHQRKHRIERGLFLVEGPHLVEEAHNAGWLIRVFSTTDTPYPNSEVVSEHVLKKLAQTKTPQGIVGVCMKKTMPRPDDRVLVILSNDPGNVGTLLRSALAFGFLTVSIPSGVDVTNDKVIRASAGALFHLSILEANLATLSTMYPTHQKVGAFASGSIEGRPTPPFMLVVGHETAGLEPTEMDILVAIKTTQVESLNAAVAGSILMERFRR